jgi:hypothetical protein
MDHAKATSDLAKGCSMNPQLLVIAILAGSILWPSCQRGSAAVSELPDPVAEDRPAGSAPELPRLAVERPTDSIVTATRVLTHGDDLQDALDDAKPGDVIALQPGAIFTGSFTLPKKSETGWITIRTNAASFPAAGTRVTPNDASLMAVIEADDDSAITAEAGAHHYRFIGIEIRPRAGMFAFNLITLGSDERSLDALPHHIVIERCYVHGDPVKGGRRGVAMNGRHIAVLDSHLSGFKERGNDTQAIAGWNGLGPFAIINNYLEAAGENVMFGGADAEVRNLVPSDIEIRGNLFSKPLSWRDSEWAVKNLFELKNARRVLVDRNVFENNWVDAQNGFAILFTPRNQDGGAPWSMVRDVTFTRNVIRHSSSGVNILGTDDNHPSQRTKRITIRDNIFEDIDGARWGGAGRLFQILDGPADVVIEHNTAFQSGDVLAGEGEPSSGFVYRNNLTPHNQYGVGGSDTYGNPVGALTRYFPGATFTGNVLIGGRAESYPAGNFFPATVSEVAFVDAAARDYRLANNSPYKGAAGDGRDIGADLDSADPLPGRRRAVSRR